MKTHWLTAWLLGMVMVSLTLGQGDLEAGFREPPASARPHTWWHWMSGNITREGITADLESMARVGIGGAQIFNVGKPGSTDIPAGPIEYMTPAWLDLMLYTAREAERLGIELCFHNCAGWSSSGGPWITPEHSMQKVVWSELEVTGPNTLAIELPQPESLMDYYRDIAVLAFPTPKNKTFRISDAGNKAGFSRRYNLQPEPGQTPSDAIIPLEGIVDLTCQLDEKGQLTWQAPAGHWTILRFGHTSTGKTNHPAPESGRGLECDKLSRAALDLHWAEGVQPVLDKLGPLAGKVLNNILVDSYEVGLNNWTPRIRDEFRNRRGYDLWLYLPALTGRVVTDGAVTERFLWDFRRTIADLIADNYFGYFAEKCHAQDLLCSVEPYHGPFECMAAGAKADIIMGEFWVIPRGMRGTLKLASSVAHTHGQTIVGAESFTSRPQNGRWQIYPGQLKSLGEWAWCNGINRFIFHRYAHQPWLDKFPGMTMGQWGSHFERTNTWWEKSQAWMTYIARSQFMLQQGRFVADVLFFAGESAPNGTVDDPNLRAAGYDFDVCGTDLIDDLRAEDGMVVLPSGMRYRVLVLRDTRFMSPALANKVRDLVRAGATVIAQRPDSSPSLTHYPQCDTQVQAIAQEVWGNPSIIAGKRSFGKGQIVWGHTPLEILKGNSVAPDFTTLDPNVNLAYIHRVVGDSDIYFVSQQGPTAKMVDCFFRVTGKRPELWNPVTGVKQSAGLWQTDAQGTRVTLPMEQKGSWFVVFRRPLQRSAVTFTAVHNETPAPIETLLPELTSGRRGVQMIVWDKGPYRLETSSGEAKRVSADSLPAPMVLNQPWTATFTPGWGAPAQIELPQLIDLAEHTDPGVRYYSGTVTYKTTFDLPPTFVKNADRLSLDLGQVKVLAEVFVNGTHLGILWCDPFRMDITAAAKPGDNSLEIRVTNLWVNRLIGDEQHPDDSEWNGKSLKAWPAWLQENKPRPSSQRLTFTTWKHWTKDEALQPSGLLGPVTLRAGRKINMVPR